MQMIRNCTYLDDTQQYISFPPSTAAQNLGIISSTLDNIHSWLTTNRLTLNPSKTEFLVIGTPQQRKKLGNISLSFGDTQISPVDSARNIGVIVDSDMSLSKHISNICRISFFQIRQLRQIRSSLDSGSAIILANSLITSRLDYCNSLFFGLPDCSIHRLQRVQNSLARVVVPTVNRRDHISPVLRELHWLPVHQRITFKIATLTYKTLAHKQPSYLYDLLKPLPQSSRRSSDKNLLMSHS